MMFFFGLCHVVDGPEIPSDMTGSVPTEAVILPFIDDEGVRDWEKKAKDDGLGGDEI